MIHSRLLNSNASQRSPSGICVIARRPVVVWVRDANRSDFRFKRDWIREFHENDTELFIAISFDDSQNRQSPVQLLDILLNSEADYCRHPIVHSFLVNIFDAAGVWGDDVLIIYESRNARVARTMSRTISRFILVRVGEITDLLDGHKPWVLMVSRLARVPWNATFCRIESQLRDSLDAVRQRNLPQGSSSPPGSCCPRENKLRQKSSSKLQRISFGKIMSLLNLRVNECRVWLQLCWGICTLRTNN